MVAERYGCLEPQRDGFDASALDDPATRYIGGQLMQWSCTGGAPVCERRVEQHPSQYGNRWQ